MSRSTFHKLCVCLREKRLLLDTFHVSVEEQVAKFLKMVGQNHSNSSVGFSFLRSGATISTYFNIVMRAMCELARELICVRSIVTHAKITSSPNRFYPYFELHSLASHRLHSPSSILRSLPQSSASAPLVADMLVLALARSTRPLASYDAFLLAGEIHPRHRPSTASVNALLAALIGAKRADLAEKAFRSALRRRMTPDIYTFNTVISALCRVGQLRKAGDLAKDIRAWGLSPSVATYNSLIDGYCKKGGAGNMYHVDMLLKEMVESRISPSAVTFRVLINGYFKNSNTGAAVRVFEEMKKQGIAATVVTYNVLISGLCREGKVEEGVKLMEEMEDLGLSPDVVTFGSVLNGFCKKGMMADAKGWIDGMPERNVEPGVVTYNILIDGYRRLGMMEDAMAVKEAMAKKGISPNVTTFTCLITGFCRCGDWRSASGLLDEMKEKGIKADVITYNVLIGALCCKGDVKKAVKLLDEMSKVGLEPNHLTYNTVIQGFCDKGNIKGAYEIRTKMEKCRKRANVVTYNVLIKYFCQIGKMEEANDLLNEMLDKGLVPNGITYETIKEGMMEKGYVSHHLTKSTAMAGAATFWLHDDILFNILSYLPAKSAARFRARVAFMARHALFLQLHHRRANRRPDQLNLFLQSSPRRDENHRNVYNFYTWHQQHGGPAKMLMRDDFSGGFASLVTKPLHGLLLISHGRCYFVFNPCTRSLLPLHGTKFPWKSHVHYIPNLTGRAGAPGYNDMSYGLGYCSATDEYKVVRLFSRPIATAATNCEVLVLDAPATWRPTAHQLPADYAVNVVGSSVFLNGVFAVDGSCAGEPPEILFTPEDSRSWELCESPASPVDLDVPAAYANGKIYWVVDSRLKESPSLYSQLMPLDMGSRKFEVIEGPPCRSHGSSRMALLELQGAIGVACADRAADAIDLWTVKDGGGGDWCLECRVELAEFSPEYSSETATPMAVDPVDGRILLNTGTSLGYYDPKSSALETIYSIDIIEDVDGLRYRFCPVICRESVSALLFRNMSRSWRHMLSLESFVKLHLQRANRRDQLKVFFHPAFPTDAEPHPDDCHFLLYSWQLSCMDFADRGFPTPITKSLNGLLLIHSTGHAHGSYYVVNPLTFAPRVNWSPRTTSSDRTPSTRTNTVATCELLAFDMESREFEARHAAMYRDGMMTLLELHGALCVTCLNRATYIVDILSFYVEVVWLQSPCS
uniref:DUF8040 domain-containing protein n=2 Tax=Leersia perrieri TaxID=77586 RepID=A0A0D9XKS6_9ORYZ